MCHKDYGTDTIERLKVMHSQRGGLSTCIYIILHLSVFSAQQLIHGNPYSSYFYCNFMLSMPCTSILLKRFILIIMMLACPFEVYEKRLNYQHSLLSGPRLFRVRRLQQLSDVLLCCDVSLYGTVGAICKI